MFKAVWTLGRVSGLFFAMALLLAGSAGGSPQQPLHVYDRHPSLQTPVEQQTPGYAGPCSDPYLPGWCQHDETLWVVNPTGCVWDADDGITVSLMGYLSAGGTVRYSECAVAGEYQHDHHHLSGGVEAPSDGLLVTLTNDRGFSQRLLPVRADTNGQVYDYLFCVQDQTPGPYPEIAGSNGGHGIAVAWTVSVTNPGRRDVKQVVAGMTMGWDTAPSNPPACN